MRYMIHLRPINPSGPFGQAHRVWSPNPPRFEGGFVVVDQAVDVDVPNDRTPVLAAWPLTQIGNVVVDALPGDAR